jgi:hypothetical protein
LALYHEQREAKVAQSRDDAVKEHVALWITDHTSTMECAALFTGIGIGSLVDVFTGNATLAATCGSVSSYLLQLVMLPNHVNGRRRARPQVGDCHRPVPQEHRQAGP